MPHKYSAQNRRKFTNNFSYMQKKVKIYINFHSYSYITHLITQASQ